MGRQKPRAELVIKTKRSWDGIIIHHSTTKAGLTVDWGDLVRFHTSYRVDGKVVDSAEYKKCFMQRKGSKFAEPMREVGYHLGIDYLEDAKGSFAPVPQYGRSFDSNGVHATYPLEHAFNNRYLGLVVVGNFDAKSLRPELWDACLRTVRSLMDAFTIPVDKVIGHREADVLAGLDNPRSCPGSLFSLEKFRKDL